jgi:CRISPR/Cas system-associated exonuclease Cas4 (RecB family)
VEEKVKDIYSILQILNSHINGEVRLEDVLIQMLEKDITSSDLLFLVLKKMRLNGYLDGEEGNLKILNKIPDEEMKKISDGIDYEVSKNKNLFVTPLEIAKFYMCPRRLFLEKIVLSKQFKEEFGKTWDGEAIHLAINLFVKNFNGDNANELIDEISSQVIKKYKDKTNLTEEQIKEFIASFYEMFQEENFSKIFTEKSFESFKVGVSGTPDLICIKENGDVIPIDIKLGKISNRGIKEEHILQSIGEAILVEEFFRKRVDYSYLIYFGSNSIEKINLNEIDKRKFISYKKMVERIGKSSHIPERTMMGNSNIRFCAGCHVRPACENIEELRRIYY